MTGGAIAQDGLRFSEGRCPLSMGCSPHCLPSTTELIFIMLYTIVVVLVILWLLGFIAHIGGGLIHLLLVIAVIVLIFNFISGRR